MAFTVFIAIEGTDGTGKTTQVQRLCDWLSHHGWAVITCRDPGGTAVGEAIRDMLLHGRNIPLDLRSEALLYMAARAQLVAEVIRPALEGGKMVVADRFLLSNIAYQGYGGGLPIDELWQIGLFATDGLLPDVTIVLDMPVSEALERVKRERDRLESRGHEYLEQVRDGFLQMACKAADRITVVRADRPPEAVHESIVQIVESFLEKHKTT